MSVKAIVSLVCLSIALFVQSSLCESSKRFKNTSAFSTRLNPKAFFSQACQDEFVYVVLYDLMNKKDQGYYLEIGAADPVANNNSYFFEKNYDWKGVSIEINERFLQPWIKQRINPLLIEDATKSDFVSILQSFPHDIDYLSLDVDGNYDYVLARIPLHNYTFKIITIEHDFYRFGNVYREKERAILNSYGYHLLCSDVIYPGLGAFEDWWIHPSAFESSDFLKLVSLDLHKKSYQEMVKILKTLIQP